MILSPTRLRAVEGTSPFISGEERRNTVNWCLIPTWKNPKPEKGWHYNRKWDKDSGSVGEWLLGVAMLPESVRAEDAWAFWRPTVALSVESLPGAILDLAPEDHTKEGKTAEDKSLHGANPWKTREGTGQPVENITGKAAQCSQGLPPKNLGRVPWKKSSARNICQTQSCKVVFQVYQSNKNFPAVLYQAILEPAAIGKICTLIYTYQIILPYVEPSGKVNKDFTI